ncbi:MAG: GTP cyclohydrolase II [Acidisphaera sp.]|nr:GTP cyclohydrolase II [Acidisphaera sp.]
MNPSLPARPAPPDTKGDGATDASLRLRAVHRAAADLRRGAPVLLVGAQTLVLLAAETAQERGLAEFFALAAEDPVLLLAPARAAALLRRPAQAEATVQALRLNAVLRRPAALRSLADPTAEQIIAASPTPAPAPADAATALMLTKLGRLLPAVLAAPARRAPPEIVLGVAAADVLDYPASLSIGLRPVAEAHVPLEDARDARVVAFRPSDGGIEHLAIVIGAPETVAAPLVRVHSECFTGDLLGSLRCDCGAQLRGAIRRIAEDGAGVVIYLAQEGRGIGLVNKLRAYALQDRGLDTLDANRALGWAVDERSFLPAAVMLEALGVRRVRLLTNNPHKLAALAACGVEVVERVGHVVPPNGVNDRYLAAKARRLGHLLD